ncbi:MAG: hypothetical protein L0229_27835 [Blastocatellia bacterium]|nr:hypothetical protein [Blastocatellia bacterium]
MSINETAISFREDATDWSRGKSWIWRAPVLLYFAYTGARHTIDPYYGSIFSGITFGIHELGHVLFSFLGEFAMVAGGSFCQLAAPIAAGIILLRQRDYFGTAVTGAWLSLSLYNLAVYIGDARAQQLPLLGLTDDPMHDWHYLLSKMGLLALDTKIAFLTRGIAFLVLLASLVLGAWLCFMMARKKET